MFSHRNRLLNILLMMMITLLFHGCFPWKNFVSSTEPMRYAFEGDDFCQWSLVRLDSMEGRWGYVSADGKEAIASVFDWADDFTNGMALVQYNGKYSYLNPDGKQMRRIKANHAYAFSEGLAGVQKRNKWGYINQKGKWVIKPQFDWTLPFSQDRAAVAVGKHYGFINPQGELVIPAQFDDTQPFVNGLSVVKKNNKFGLIDTLGQNVQPIIYRRIEPWKNETYKLHANNKKIGLANRQGQMILDTVYTTLSLLQDKFYFVVQNNFEGLFDLHGNEVLPVEYQFLSTLSKEGFLVGMKDDKYGVIAISGQILVPFVYDNIRFSEGRFYLQKDDNAWLMDNSFQLIRELPKYENNLFFYNGLALIHKKVEAAGNRTRLGYINKMGEEVIAPQYDYAYHFNDHGLAIVGTRDNGISRYTVIDTTGMKQPSGIPDNHPGVGLYNLRPFGKRLFFNESGGQSLVFLASQTGRFLPDMPYTSFSPLKYSDRNDLARVYIHSKVGLIDTTLTERLPVHFESISAYNQNRIAVKQNGKWGYADEKFRLRIPFVYDRAPSFKYGYAKVEQNKLQGVINTKGRDIIPLKYENITIDTISNRIYAKTEQVVDIYDQYGRLLLSREYSYIGGFWGRGYSTFRMGDKMGVMNSDFKVICEPQYDHIGRFYDDRAWVINDKKGGFIDNQFQLVIPVAYDDIEEFAMGFTRVEKNGESFYIDIYGRRIHPSEQDIAERKEIIEDRRKGFIDFSS